MKQKIMKNQKNSPKTPVAAFAKSLRYLNFRIRSVKETEDYLAKKEFPQDIIQQTIDRLIDLKFLDDREFGRIWIESRQKHRGKSIFVLRTELRMKGLNNELIEELLNDSQNDLTTAKELFERKKRQLSRHDGDEYKQKSIQFLQRRGYSWNIIKKVLDEKDIEG